MDDMTLANSILANASVARTLHCQLRMVSSLWWHRYQNGCVGEKLLNCTHRLPTVIVSWQQGNLPIYMHARCETAMYWMYELTWIYMKLSIDLRLMLNGDELQRACNLTLRPLTQKAALNRFYSYQSKIASFTPYAQNITNCQLMPVWQNKM